LITLSKGILNQHSPHHPRALADLILHDSSYEKYREQAEKLIPGHPLVAEAIGIRLAREGNLKEAVPYIETAAHELGKRDLVTWAAEAFRIRGDEESWVNMLSRYAEQSDQSFTKARTFIDIARHYMSTGRAETALPYSLNAASLRSAGGGRIAVFNHLILGDREQALHFMEEDLNQYGHGLHRRMGYWMFGELGDLDALRREILEAPPGTNEYITFGRFLFGSHEEAVRELIQIYELKKDNYYLLFASLILLLLASGHFGLAKTQFIEAVHLNPKRSSFFLIHAALRSLDVDPLDVFRTPLSGN
jgi:tetratricopeptide (TPR) repeat protein